MKRLLAAILAICYLSLSTGFTLHVHYCMGKQVSTSLIDKGDIHKCSHCGMEKKLSGNGCCKDEHKVLKSKTDAAFVKTVIIYTTSLDAITPELTYNSYDLPVAFLVQQKIDNSPPHGPPLATNMRLHVRNCVFLI